MEALRVRKRHDVLLRLMKREFIHKLFCEECVTSIPSYTGLTACFILQAHRYHIIGRELVDWSCSISYAISYKETKYNIGNSELSYLINKEVIC